MQPSSSGAPAPHADVPGGCLGCHGSLPASSVDGGARTGRGIGHDFRATEARCAGCHYGGAPRAPSLHERARALWKKLSPEIDESRPPHAAATLPTVRGPEQARALEGLLLLLEDPAAAVHNAPVARELLERAERAFGR